MKTSSVFIIFALFTFLLSSTGCKRDSLNNKLISCNSDGSESKKLKCSEVAAFKDFDACERYKIIYSAYISYNELLEKGSTEIRIDRSMKSDPSDLSQTYCSKD